MLTTRKHLVQVGNKTTFPPSLDIAFKDITLFFFSVKSQIINTSGFVGFCCSSFSLPLVILLKM